jgi:hypothetical protein
VVIVGTIDSLAGRVEINPHCKEQRLPLWEDDESGVDAGKMFKTIFEFI